MNDPIYGNLTPEAYAGLHKAIFWISAVIFGMLLVFSMFVMPYFVIRFGWGYNP